MGHFAYNKVEAIPEAQREDSESEVEQEQEFIDADGVLRPHLSPPNSPLPCMAFWEF